MKHPIMKLAACAMLVALSMGQAAPEGCDQAQAQPPSGSKADVARQQAVQDRMGNLQSTPTDIRFSLERYNLIRRAYWVNGMREKALSIPCPVERPVGYIVLITKSGSILGQFIVDGKLSSLNSYLTPESEYAEIAIAETGEGHHYTKEVNRWLADVDGCYGSNDPGTVFFFTPDGKYMEWKGDYLYSDIPFQVEAPVLKVGAK